MKGGCPGSKPKGNLEAACHDYGQLIPSFPQGASPFLRRDLEELGYTSR
jgi:hypothetical protein